MHRFLRVLIQPSRSAAITVQCRSARRFDRLGGAGGLESTCPAYDLAVGAALEDGSVEIVPDARDLVHLLHSFVVDLGV
jgi:hypothetical protein